ncbi:hypothetical protein O6P43_013469 [Quillaja saponaria]|nr:hypothetical protein O6P43_013469 [Quillaja saponaria]
MKLSSVADVLEDLLKVAGYQGDVEQRCISSLIKKTHIGRINVVLYDSVFWGWQTRIDFIVELSGVEKQMSYLSFQFRAGRASSVFDADWRTKVKQNADLEALKLQYDDYQKKDGPKSSEPLSIKAESTLACLHFMNATFIHLDLMTAQIQRKKPDFRIRNRRELQSLYEQIFPGHIIALADISKNFAESISMLRPWKKAKAI